MSRISRKNRTKQELPRLSTPHIIWVWTKWLVLAAWAMAVVGYISNNGIGTSLAVGVAFLIIRSLIQWAVRVVVMLAYIILLALTMCLMIL